MGPTANSDQQLYAATVPLRRRAVLSQDPSSPQIGGVLCQSVYAEGEYAVTVGIGLNVSNSQPSTCESGHNPQKTCPAPCLAAAALTARGPPRKPRHAGA